MFSPFLTVKVLVFLFTALMAQYVSGVDKIIIEIINKKPCIFILKRSRSVEIECLTTFKYAAKVKRSNQIALILIGSLNNS